MTTNNSRRLSLALGSTLLLTASAMSGDGVCEIFEGMHPNSMKMWPYYTMTRVTAQYTNDCGVVTSQQSSGVLISAHCVLTAGHVVFQNPRFSNGTCEFDTRYRGTPDCMTVTPGFVNGGAPYGVRTSLRRSVPAEFTERDRSWKYLSKHDYGLIRLKCPFEHTNDFMGVRFDYNWQDAGIGDGWENSKIYGEGYGDTWPSGDNRLISSAHGEITGMPKRRIRSRHFLKAGHSGGCLTENAYTLSSDQPRRIIGVFSHGTTNSYCAGSARMCKQNEALVRSWINWKPSPEESANCGNLIVHPWAYVLNEILSRPQMLIPMEELNLIPPIDDYQGEPNARTMQIIEGEFYEWVEFKIEPDNPASPMFIRMISPIEQDLMPEEAQALLSASANWHEDIIEPTEYVSVEDPENLQPMLVINDQHIDDENEEPDDLTPDTEAPEVIEDEEPELPGDIDGDGVVGPADLGMILSFWGQPGKGDLNGDGTTNAADLGMILANWGNQLP